LKVSFAKSALLAALFCTGSAVTAAPTPDIRQALNQAIRDTCGKQVVLLGEASHGDGATMEFKTRLIRRLTDECGFNALFFEASHYDFLALSRKFRLREPASPDMLSSSIGRLWNQYEELAPLIAFLFARAKDGRMALGGLDDQLGSAGAFYSLDDMPDELMDQLAGDRRGECRAALRRRIRHDYSKAFPNSAAEQARLRSCLVESKSALSAGANLDPDVRAERLQMLANIQRALARSPMDVASYVRNRDLSMYVNFRWLADRLPPRSKIIVWSATSHAARDASVTGQFAPGAGNLGSYLDRAYGPRAFVLGFSAASGAFHYSRDEPARKLGPAGPGSLEAGAVAGARLDAVYLGPTRLRRLGAVPGSLFSHNPLTAKWSEIVDGVVVFREERPPRRLP
jgi:erythromycin esterase-like protein